jgi:hypothetical protein
MARRRESADPVDVAPPVAEGRATERACDRARELRGLAADLQDLGSSIGVTVVQASAFRHTAENLRLAFEDPVAKGLRRRRDATRTRRPGNENPQRSGTAA